jgi:hypothetical protein
MAISFDKQVELDRKKQIFLEWLIENHTGKENSIIASKIPQWGSPREIRYIIHELRKENHPICSYSKGYFFSTNEEDICKTIDFILNIRVMEAVDGLKGFVKNKSKYEKINKTNGIREVKQINGTQQMSIDDFLV